MFGLFCILKITDNCVCYILWNFIIFGDYPRNYCMLAKTAEYDPSNKTVSVYVDGRHPKDILRSIAHELVHHHQNERGELSGGHSGAGYAQNDPHMRDLEAKA